MTATTTSQVMNLIDGCWRPALGGQTYGRCNPADPDVVLDGFPESGPDDVHAAVEAARKAFGPWAALTDTERARHLEAVAALADERAELIARTMTEETGKPLREAAAEAPRFAATLRYFAASAWQLTARRSDSRPRMGTSTRVAAPAASSV